MARSALGSFGTSVFTTYSQLAREHDAVNLGQGFPDFDGPEWIQDAAREAMRAGFNQYAPSPGLLRLRNAVAAACERHWNLRYDPAREITVTTGATEGIAAAIFGLVDPGDEVLTFEPFYDSYPACCAMTGATMRAVPLQAPEFGFDRDELAAAFTNRTRLFILNTPHNPTGRVFRRDELEFLLECCRRHDCLVLSDEVYEHLTFDDHAHLSPAAIDRDRVVRLSSAAKTFSLTGWKVGWACAPADRTDAIRRAHQFLVFCTATPLQEAIAIALERADDYYATFRAEYAERRGALLRALDSAGYRAIPPEGTYFAMADVGEPDGAAFVRRLIEEKGVAAIPPESFYEHPEHARGLVRFAFCKTVATIEEAANRLGRRTGGR
ncbi:MAG: aminotransferase class I/II-fold pyridoxal phosphate-dependent enzyme [Planctomycetota bacterium]|jgi:N-succinyldiaminopimelate aminotransferase